MPARPTPRTGPVLRHTSVRRLDPLVAAHRLRRLYLDGTRVVDLAPLAGLPQLAELSVVGLPAGVDLSPFAGRRRLVIRLGRHQEVRGIDQLGPGVRLDLQD